MKLTKKIPFGKTGLEVPQIIYGTSYLGNLYVALPYQDKLELMRKWFECTLKPIVIDSAGKYGAGLALEVIGKGLKDLGIIPEDIIISNKLGWYRVPLRNPEPTFEPGVWVDIENDAVQLFSYDGIIDCWKQGNELLGGIFQADVVSVHDPDEYLFAANDNADREKRMNDILESYRALFDLKKEGKVKAVGIGAKDWLVIRELYQHVPFDWVMLANSYTIMHHPNELLGFVDKLYTDGVGIINSAVFHAGFLTGGKFYNYIEVDPETVNGQYIYSWRDRFHKSCAKHDILPCEACIHFGISHLAIASIALNTSKPEKMNLNIEILQRKIPDFFWADMKKEALIAQEYKYL